MNSLVGIAALVLAVSLNAQADPVMIISKKAQTYKVVDGKKVLRKGRVSTGKKGYITPSGTFIIRTKLAQAYSNKYKTWMYNAMFFQELKYAIHAGHVPKYPASHGCVRVTLADSEALFDMLPVGTKVEIK